MAQVTALIHEYLRHDKKFPHVWCPGCGNNAILAQVQKTLPELKDMYEPAKRLKFIMVNVKFLAVR